MSLILHPIIHFINKIIHNLTIQLQKRYITWSMISFKCLANIFCCICLIKHGRECCKCFLLGLKLKKLVTQAQESCSASKLYGNFFHPCVSKGSRMES